MLEAQHNYGYLNIVDHTYHNISQVPTNTHCTVFDILKSHNDALDDHERITIAEYMREHRKIVTRHCDKHRNMVLSLGCRTCLIVFCNHCVSEDSICASGKLKYLSELQLIYLYMYLYIYIYIYICVYI